MSAGSAAFAHIEDRLADTLLYEKGLDEVLQEQAKRIIKETRELRKRCERLEAALQGLLDSGACDFHGGNQAADDNKCPICTATWVARAALSGRAGDGQ